MVLPVKQVGRFIRENGTTATITVYEDAGTTDNRGNQQWNEVNYDVDAILSYSRRSIQTSTELGGRQFVIETEIYLTDSDFNQLGIGDPLPADTKHPEVTVEGVKYDVFETEQPGHGITRLICRKKRAS